MTKKTHLDTAPSLLRTEVTRYFDEHSIVFCDVPCATYSYSVTLTTEHGERTCGVIDRSKATDTAEVAHLIDRLREHLIANEVLPLDERRIRGYRL